MSDGTYVADGAKHDVETDQNKEEIRIFDELMNGDMNLAEDMERADEKWYTNHSLQPPLLRIRI